MLEPCTARFAAARSRSGTRDGTYANPEISKKIPATPVKNATTTNSGRLSTPASQATGMTAISSARARSAGIMIRRWSRPSTQLPTSSENSRLGSIAAVATALTPAGPAPRESAATSGKRHHGDLAAQKGQRLAGPVPAERSRLPQQVDRRIRSSIDF